MINIEKLDFYYTKRKNLFEDLDLHLEKGKIYGLLGKNGTGKSTLLKLISGTLFPKDGNITIDSMQAKERHPDILQDIFFLTEEYELPAITMRDFIAANSPFYSKFDSDAFKKYLDMFEVDFDSKLNKLSYGQKKKALISFGIATNAKYLILDEPTNGLDIPSKSQFRKVMLSGFREDQIMIISTHQVRDLNQLIEAVIILENGKIVLNQDISNLESKIQFTKSFTDKPIEGSIYSELTPGGYVHLMKNDEQMENEVELEVLFNAAIQKQNELNQLLN